MDLVKYIPYGVGLALALSRLPSRILEIRERERLGKRIVTACKAWTSTSDAVSIPVLAAAYGMTNMLKASATESHGEKTALLVVALLCPVVLAVVALFVVGQGVGDGLKVWQQHLLRWIKPIGVILPAVLDYLSSM